MKKQSAGIVLYRNNRGLIEVLLGHAGGPFWSKKDDGAWSIPKGEFTEGEEPLAAAKREFQEELGLPLPAGAEPLELGSIKRKDGKTIYAWAVEGDLDAQRLTSNTFEMEWPPKSGRMQQFPEFDRGAWFPLHEAGPKMHQGQNEFIARLAEKLGFELTPPPNPPSPAEPLPPKETQTSLF